MTLVSRVAVVACVLTRDMCCVGSNRQQGLASIAIAYSGADPYSELGSRAFADAPRPGASTQERVGGWV